MVEGTGTNDLSGAAWVGALRCEMTACRNNPYLWELAARNPSQSMRLVHRVSIGSCSIWLW